jgi:hypothetical protein
MPSITTEQLAAAGGTTQVTINLDAVLPFIIREPSPAELDAFIATIEAKVIDAFWAKALVSPSPYDASLPYALKCSDGGHVAIPLKRLLGHTNIDGLPKSPKPADVVGKLGYEATSSTLMAIKPPTLALANEVLTQAGRARLNAPSLAELLSRVGSFAALADELSAMTGRACQEKRFAFSVLVAMRAQNWILLPTDSPTKLGHILKGMALRDNQWSDSPLSLLSPSQTALVAALTGEPTGKDYLDFTARVKARHMVLCTTLSGLHHMTWPLAERILFSSGKKARTGANTLANPALRLRWKAICRGNGPVAMVEIDDVDHLANLRSRAPEDPRLEEWLQFLAKDCEGYTGGELHPIYNDYIIWPKWLHTLDHVPELFEVSRTHIRDESDPMANTYHRFLSEYDCLLTKSRNQPLMRMDKLFQRMGRQAEERGSVFVNPIRLVEDKFKQQRGEQPDRTVKSRIPPRIIEELQDLIVVRGADGKFSWSEEIKALATVKVLKDGQAEEVFCPIYPSIIYFMTVYPLRARQALWLDSGEQDEFVLDFDSRKFIPNPSGRGIKGRAMGFLQPATDESEIQEFKLDFHVAVNKTFLAKRRRSSFTIHYVPEVVIWIAREMLQWQQRYGTVPHLVKECDSPDAGTKKNSKLQQFYPELCPIFRYPGAQDFYPPSHSQLSHFWGKFCGVYDRKNKAANLRRPELSHPYTRNGYSWDLPNFSIHSLRVAGVSALLDAGLPLGVVASMTGHFSLAMTLYYYREDGEHIRRLISEAKVKMKDLPDLNQIVRHLDDCQKLDDLFVGTPQALKRLGESQNTRIWQLSISGICPGATCDEGLPREFWQAHGRGVPGAKCALCQFRVYGAPFLLGLVFECNCLIFELEQLANKQVSLRATARKAEADGRLVDAATAQGEEDMLEQESQLQLKVLARLYEMIHESAEKLTNPAGNGRTSTALLTQDERHLQAQMEAAGQFAQLKAILEDSEVFQTSRQVVPDQALRLMQEKFMRMCRTNGAEALLAGLPSDIAKKATLALAGLLERAVPQRDLRESLFQGQIGFAQLPGRGEHLQAGIRKLDDAVRAEEAKRLDPPEKPKQITA